MTEENNEIIEKEEITHSIYVDDAGVLRTDISCVDYSGLAVLRSMKIPITTRIGRIPILTMDFSSFKQSDYDMRKKAEVLQYRKNQTPFSKKYQYAQISKNNSYYYSNQALLKKIESGLICPRLDLIVNPPTNSGIHDYTFPGYYLDVNVNITKQNNNLNS